MDSNKCSYLTICNHQSVDVLGACGERGATYETGHRTRAKPLSTMPPIIDMDVNNMVKTVYIGKTYKGSIISKKKPANAIKLAETKSFRRYALGAKEHLVAKPGYKLVRM